MELIQQIEAWQTQADKADKFAEADMDVAKRLLKHGAESLEKIVRLERELAELRAKGSAIDWIEFDGSNHPPEGFYLIWDECLRDSSKPMIWSYRRIGRMESWRKPKEGEMVWFNEGNWRAERGPSHYAYLTTPSMLFARPTLNPEDRADAE